MCEYEIILLCVSRLYSVMRVRGITDVSMCYFCGGSLV